MIRYARQEENKTVKDIFNICFPGEEKFASWFFEKIYDCGNTLVYEKNGDIIAALQMLPVKLTDGKNVFSASYLYGVGTLPEYRGKGIMAEVIRHSFDLDKEHGTDYSILIVQEQSLLEYYSRFGFEKYFSVSENIFDVNSDTIDFRRAEYSDFDGINSVYKKQCDGKLYALRDEKYWDSLYDMYSETAFVHEINGKIDSYVLGYFTEESFVATECMGENAVSLVNSVAVFHGKKQIKCISLGHDKFIGMIKSINTPLKDLEAYINLLYN